MESSLSIPLLSTHSLTHNPLSQSRLSHFVPKRFAQPPSHPQSLRYVSHPNALISLNQSILDLNPFSQSLSNHTKKQKLKQKRAHLRWWRR